MFEVIIPARLESSRLPNKVLAMIGSEPMVVHVLKRALQSQAARVTVAVDDERVARAVEGLGATVVMTSKLHKTGTDRIAEVIHALNIDPDTIIINLQSDEPFIPPGLINQLANHLENTGALMGSLYDHIKTQEDYLNPNLPKLVLDARGFAQYFSRAPIPHQTGSTLNALGHIGIYAYRAHFVKTFCQWPQGQLEKLERLEQLRALEQGVEIAMLKTNYLPQSVDTEEDLALARQLFEQTMEIQ